MPDRIDTMKSRTGIQSIAVILVCIVLLGVLAYISLTVPVHRWGDSSTYYLQISSITNDHDLRYEPVDIGRASLTGFDDLPAGLFLIKTSAGDYFFGKEFTYALAASPFYALSGNAGILFFNALLFWLMVLMGYLYLAKNGNSPLLSLVFSALFFCVSTAVVYLFWIHAEIFNMFLITAGIFFWSKYARDNNNEKYLLIAACIFGLATVAKLPNGLIFLPFLCHELYRADYRKTLAMTLLFLAPLAVAYGFLYLETGSVSFYGGNRFFYINQFPFIEGCDPVNDCGFPAFSVSEGNLDILFSSDLLVKSPYNLFYYFFGRFTGMIWYYPLAAAALVSFAIGIFALKKQDPDTSCTRLLIQQDPARFLICTGIVLSILFYTIILGNNYLGGGHAVGNRYFSLLPAFLFLVGKINGKAVVPFVLIALVTVIPVIAHPVVTSQSPEDHTFRFPYTLFPFEYSQIDSLPLVSYRYVYPDYTLYATDGRTISVEQGIVVIGSSHWLVRTRSGDPDFTVTLSTERPGTQLVSIRSGSGTTDVVLDGTGKETMRVPLGSPVYADSGYRLYSLVVSAPPGVFLEPQKAA